MSQHDSSPLDAEGAQAARPRGFPLFPSSAPLREHPEVEAAHLPVSPAAFSVLRPGTGPRAGATAGFPAPVGRRLPSTLSTAMPSVSGFSEGATGTGGEAPAVAAGHQVSLSDTLLPPGSGVSDAPWPPRPDLPPASMALVAVPQQHVAAVQAPAAEAVSAVLGPEGAAWLRELRPRYEALRAQRAQRVPLQQQVQATLRQLLLAETGSAAQAIRQGLSTVLSAVQVPSEAAIEQVLAARPKHGHRLASEHGVLEMLQQLSRPASLIAEALAACNQDRRQAFQDEIPETFLPLAVAYLAGWGVLEALRTPDVTDVIITPRETVVDRHGRLELAGPGWDGETIAIFVEQMGGPKPNATQATIDWRLPDGSRGNATHPATGEGTLCIRRHPEISLTAQDLLASGTLTEQTYRFLQAAMAARLNLIIAGSTGSGKTTLLKVCLDLIPRGERAIIIEQEFKELPDPMNCISYSRFHSGRATPDHPDFLTMDDLVTNALRQRPDRIFIGECRGAEVLAMLAASNTGHEGTLTTLHANAADAVMRRLVTLATTANPQMTEEQVQRRIVEVFQLIFFLRRDEQGGYGVHEVLSLAPSAEPGRTYTATPIFQRTRVEGRWVCQRTSALLDQGLTERFAEMGVSLDWLEGGRNAQ